MSIAQVIGCIKFSFPMSIVYLIDKLSERATLEPAVDFPARFLRA